MRRTPEDAAATRAALLEAALFVFAEQGVESATLAEVAGRAGLTRGALYHHFADKAALHTAALSEWWDLVAAPVWAALDGSCSRAVPLALRLHTFAATWLDALRSDRRFQALITVSLHSGGATTSDDPTSMPDKNDGFAAWHDRLAATLTAGRAELADGVDPRNAAAHLLAWLCGTALLAGTSPGLLPPADAAGVAPTLQGLLP